MSMVEKLEKLRWAFFYFSLAQQKRLFQHLIDTESGIVGLNWPNMTIPGSMVLELDLESQKKNKKPRFQGRPGSTPHLLPNVESSSNPRELIGQRALRARPMTSSLGEDSMGRRYVARETSGE